jgi:hypothetical protein
MNSHNFIGIRIKKADYFKLPPSMRMQAEGPFVLSTVNGRETFVPAVIIE